MIEGEGRTISYQHQNLHNELNTSKSQNFGLGAALILLLTGLIWITYVSFLGRLDSFIGMLGIVFFFGFGFLFLTIFLLSRVNAISEIVLMENGFELRYVIRKPAQFVPYQQIHKIEIIKSERERPDYLDTYLLRVKDKRIPYLISLNAASGLADAAHLKIDFKKG